MMAYDSYLPKIEKIVGSAFNVAWLNIGISLLAGLVIFPAVFALGFTPDQDPSLSLLSCQLFFNKFLLVVFFIVFLVLLLFPISANCYHHRIHTRNLRKLLKVAFSILTNSV
ncbi:hypothetical protein [Rummeliibacillus sp. BSL5]